MNTFRHIFNSIKRWLDEAYAPASKGVTNGDGHDHDGGDGAQIQHSSLGGVSPTQHHDNSNDPTADQKAALAGTHGSPSGSNKYVTDSDPRNTDARTPLAHNHDASDINSGTIDGDRLPGMSQTKTGGVPATGTPSGKYLRDDGTWQSAGVSAHAIGGDSHTADTLANLNSKVSDATLESTAGSQSKVDAHAALNASVHGVSSSGFEDKANKNVANGYCPLDSSAIVPLNKIPATLTGKDADTVDGSHASAFAPASKGVTNGDSHDHNGGDGAQIQHSSLGGVTSDQHHAQLHHASHEPGGGDAMTVDAAASTGSLRTLGTGAQQAAAGNHGHSTYLPLSGGTMTGLITDAGLNMKVVDCPNLSSTPLNNWNPTGLSTAGVLKLDTNDIVGNITITGIMAQAEGRMLVLFNYDPTYNFILSNNDTRSDTTNRFLMPSDVTLTPYEACVIMYLNSRWRVISE
jgi:hypothetical protein